MKPQNQLQNESVYTLGTEVMKKIFFKFTIFNYSQVTQNKALEACKLAQSLKEIWDMLSMYSAVIKCLPPS